MLPNFKVFHKGMLLKQTKLRRFETKLGERIHCAAGDKLAEAIAATTARYVIFGIPEDIGVHANLGVGGAATAWAPFLDSFLNVQSNDFLDGNEIFLAGWFDFSKVKNLIKANAASDEEKTKAFRHAVNAIDEEVEELVKLIIVHNKMPVAIGGGHNNAYPLIAGAAKAQQKKHNASNSSVNCINLDAHMDYRPLEGRHSGNPFRYAKEEGYLGKYCALGIHENYLQQNVLNDIMKDESLDFITWENIFLHEKMNFHQAMAHAVGFCDNKATGIELDLDSIAGVLSSAATPTGFEILHARQYVNFLASRLEVAYLHISEGIATNDAGVNYPLAGKLISYLVTDFIKSHKLSGNNDLEKLI